MLSTVLSLLVLLTIALLGGAFVLWRKGGSTKQILLMLGLAVVVAVNVAIWTVPTKQGTSPYDQARQIEGAD
ncbi:MAG: hypothetical protein ACK5NN_04440 [Sphingomonadaceae bacterium]